MSLFIEKAPHVMGQLMHDFRLVVYQAAGAVGSIGRECDGFEKLREIGAAPGAGGYGWCMWTASRAHEFLVYAQQNHLDWRSDEANYGYLKRELSGRYRSTAISLRAAKTLAEAVEVFEQHYERAGVVAMADRLEWAEIALAAYRKEHPQHVS